MVFVRIKLNSAFWVFGNRIEDDDEIERELEHVDITAKEKCVIQWEVNRTASVPTQGTLIALLKCPAVAGESGSANGLTYTYNHHPALLPYIVYHVRSHLRLPPILVTAGRNASS